MQETYREDEITLKDLILKVQEYAKTVFKNWFLAGVITAITVLGFLYVHYTTIITYPAKIKFVVEGESGSAGLGSLLGQFGINNNTNNNPYKILEVAQSSRIFKEAVSRECEGELIANKFLNDHNLIEDWADKNPKFEGFQFTDLEAMEAEIERKAFIKLSKRAWGRDGKEPILYIDFDLDTGIFECKANTRNTDLSYCLIHGIYEETKNFFEDDLLSNQRKTLAILESKVDSINLLRELKTGQLATFDDQNRNTILFQSKVKRNLLQQEVQGLTMAYSRLLENKERAAFMLQSIEPLFLAIETPIQPLSLMGSNLSKKLVYGIITGIFLAILIIITRKMYQDIMNDNDTQHA